MTTGKQDNTKGTDAMPVGIASTDQLGAAPERATLDDGTVVLRRGAAEWRDGEPYNLAAAAEDAYEWLWLMDRMTSCGTWRFGRADSAPKLRRCMEELRRVLGTPND